MYDIHFLIYILDIIHLSNSTNKDSTIYCKTPIGHYATYTLRTLNTNSSTVLHSPNKDKHSISPYFLIYGPIWWSWLTSWLLQEPHRRISWSRKVGKVLVLPSRRLLLKMMHLEKLTHCVILGHYSKVNIY